MPATQSQSTRVKPRNGLDAVDGCKPPTIMHATVNDAHVASLGHALRGLAGLLPAMRRARSSSRGSYGQRSYCRARATAPLLEISSQEIAAFLSTLAAVFLCYMLLQPWQNLRENRCRSFIGCRRCCQVLDPNNIKLLAILSGLDSWRGTSI
jgi:hypothetical protein